jgi:hypothetical protein
MVCFACSVSGWYYSGGVMKNELPEAPLFPCDPADPVIRFLDFAWNAAIILAGIAGLFVFIGIVYCGIKAL